MDKNAIEEYKREMMKLYGRSTPAENGRTFEEQHPVSEEISEVDDKAPDDTAYSTAVRYPDPDLTELDMTEPEYPTEESLGASEGYILVNTRTGENSSPVANASVVVTAIVDGNRMIIASGVTDDSGVSPKFSVPAPDIIHSQSPAPDKRPYSLFDISVTARGFFNARSVDVPVFAGITSVQNFGMIPVPLMMQSSDETVTYINQEPDFSDHNERT